MGEDPNSEFVKLTQAEAYTRIKSIVDAKALAKIWSKGQKSIACHLVAIEFDTDLVLIVKSKELNGVAADEKILLNFSYRGLSHFICGVIQETQDGLFEVLVQGDIYKLEKRLEERVLTFPHYQAYAYFRVDHEKDEHNVLAFNQSQKSNIESFKKFEKKIHDSNDHLSELMGFRVLDISKDGLALLVNKKEGSFFPADQDGQEIEFTFTMDGEALDLKASEIIYNIDYVSSGSSFGPMCKVGLQILPNQQLEDFLNNYIETDDIEKKVFRDFEEFIEED